MTERGSLKKNSHSLRHLSSAVVTIYVYIMFAAEMREDGIEAEEEGEEKALNATDTSPIPPSSMDSSKVFQAVKTFRKSRTVSLIVVSLALLLDYMLITVVGKLAMYIGMELSFVYSIFPQYKIVS